MTQHVQNHEHPPQATMLDLLLGMMKTQAIHEAVRLDIASLIKDEPKSITELSETTGMNKSALSRLLHALESLGIFQEVKPDYFAQTPLSHVLRPNVPGSMYDVAFIHGEQWQWRPWEQFSYSIQTGQTAFNSVFEGNLFDYFAKHPEEGERFNKAMTGFSRQVDQPITRGYDFSSIHTIVDIGGGYGSLLTAILRAYPHLQGILFDLPHVIKDAQERIASSDVAGRCQFIAGDMFNAEDIPGADAYIMKQIIKDWSDEESVRILSNCSKAMKSGGKILVAEQVLLPGRQMSTAKLIDLQLMVVLSGQERYEQQYRALFEGAGLQVLKIWPTHSTYSIIEGLAK